MSKRRKFSKLLAVLLTAAMLFQIMPLSVFADDDNIFESEPGAAEYTEAADGNGGDDLELVNIIDTPLKNAGAGTDADDEWIGPEVVTDISKDTASSETVSIKIFADDDPSAKLVLSNPSDIIIGKPLEITQQITIEKGNLEFGKTYLGLPFLFNGPAGDPFIYETFVNFTMSDVTSGIPVSIDWTEYFSNDNVEYYYYNDLYNTSINTWLKDYGLLSKYGFDLRTGETVITLIPKMTAVNRIFEYTITYYFKKPSIIMSARDDLPIIAQASGRFGAVLPSASITAGNIDSMLAGRKEAVEVEVGIINGTGVYDIIDGSGPIGTSSNQLIYPVTVDVTLEIMTNLAPIPVNEDWAFFFEDDATITYNGVVTPLGDWLDKYKTGSGNYLELRDGIITVTLKPKKNASELKFRYAIKCTYYDNNFDPTDGPIAEAEGYIGVLPLNKVIYYGNKATSGTMDDEPYMYDEIYYLSTSNYLRTGYTFAGWKMRDDPDIPAVYDSGAMFVMSDGDVEFDAVWDADEQLLYYDGNGATSGKMATEEHITDAVFYLTGNMYLKSGYLFKGWDVNEDGIADYADKAEFKMPPDNYTLVAVWGAVDYTVTVTGSYADKTGAGVYIYGDEVKIDAGSRNGYAFNGWTSDVAVLFDDSGNGKTSFPMPAGNVKITANWAINNYDIEYVLNGGTNSGDNPKTYTVETPTITLKSPSRSDYRFTGWSDDGMIPLGSTGKKTFTAGWTFIETEPSNRGGGPGKSGLAPAPAAVEEIVDDEQLPGSEAIFRGDHVAYIIGYPEGDVRPENNITRAETVTAFYRLLSDYMRSSNWAVKNGYPDVADDSWYNVAISVMTKVGVIQGYEDGTFKPDDNITRAELAAVAARFARLMDLDSAGRTKFTDISGHWAEADIVYVASIGWYLGYEDGSFKPDQPITRAEFMAIVNRMLQRVPKSIDDIIVSKMKVWVDNMDESEWYYLVIQEATNSHEAEYFENDKVPGMLFNYEKWISMVRNPDWVKLEAQWIADNA